MRCRSKARPGEGGDTFSSLVSCYSLFIYTKVDLSRHARCKRPAAPRFDSTHPRADLAAFYFTSVYPCEDLEDIYFSSTHPCEGLADTYFASDRPCVGPAEVCFSSAYPREGPAEVCFVAKLTEEGPTDCHFVPNWLRASLMGCVWRLSELPEQVYLTISTIRKHPRCIYTLILISGKFRSIYTLYYKSSEYSDQLKTQF